MSAAVDAFIDELTRVYLIDWCQQTIAHEKVIDVTAIARTDAEKACAQKCFQHAMIKGWVSPDPAKPQKVLASGFSVAKSFLKR